MIEKFAIETVNVFAIPLTEDSLDEIGEGSYWRRESLIESVVRRLSELKISREQVAQSLEFTFPNMTVDRLNEILNEEERPTSQEMNFILGFVGLELVAIPISADMESIRSVNGHWYWGERCQYCGTNIYDHGSDEACASSPLNAEENS
jgi:hypothetical protein